MFASAVIQKGLNPPDDLVAWFQRAGGALPGEISGESLKFFASGLPVARLCAPPDRFPDLAASIQRRELTLPDMTRAFVQPGEARIYLQLPERTEEYQLLIRPETDAYGEEALSIDRLRWSANEPHGSPAWRGPAGALADLQARTLRPVRLPDATRADLILRFVSLAAMLDFTPSTDALAAFQAGYRREDAAALGRKFLNRQFKRLLCGARPSRGFLLMEEIGMLDWFLPELRAGLGLTQNRYHKYDVFYHCIYTCDAVPEPDLKLRLSALFHDLGKVDTRRVLPNGEATFHNHEVIGAKHTERIMRRFGFEPDLLKRVRFLVRHHMFHYTAEWTDRAVRRFTKKTPPDMLEDLIRLRLADRKGSGKRTALPQAIKDLMRHIARIRAEEAELKTRDLKINGHRLMELGMAPGRPMGDLLRDLLEAVKAGQLPNESDALEAEARRRMGALAALAEAAAARPAQIRNTEATADEHASAVL